METNNNKIFMECDCMHEIVQIQVDKDEDENFWYFAIYNYGNPNSYSLWQRVCFCFRFLKTGRLHGDQIVFKDKQMLEIKQFIEENVK